MLNSHDIPAYTILETKDLPEVHGTGFLLSHNKTKARVLVIENKDPNKVFYAGFRTPATNSRGIQHIVEHTVLCGSKKFPAKDPFVELAKGSLNTFLNAMTYPDKTVYPIASCNEKDFRNLMDVYLDAVFHPNIYDRWQIFEQEGWHYELENEESPLVINGVVYNEMRGVYSSPDAMISNAELTNLFPDSVYRHDSGGNPADIPTLTREEYLDYHARFYHPSNSYIYLYGDMNTAEHLNYIDEEYLSDYDYLYVDSEIAKQEPFAKPVNYEATFDLAETESEEEETNLAFHAVIGETLDPELVTAFDILSYVLLDVPGAPLKTALVDAGICSDAEASYETDLRQPVFSVVARNSEPEHMETFRKVIRETLEKQAEGMNKRAILAAINRFEFQHREGNTGRYPKGLMYGLEALSTWLYDDTRSMDVFSLNPIYKTLREKAENTDYFEELIRTWILRNPHAAWGVIKPEKGKNAKADAALAESLAEKKAAMTDEERAALIQHTAELKAYQNEPSTKEELETIPLLSISDISREARRLSNLTEEAGGVKVIRHDIDTNGIDYIRLLFRVDDLSQEDFLYLTLLGEIYKYVDTEHYTYDELATEINLCCGGIGFTVSTYEDIDGDGWSSWFTVNMKVLPEQVEQGMKLVEEILFTSKITDEKRLREIIAEIRADRNSLIESGHTTASMRALSYISSACALQDTLGGVEFFRWITDLDKNFDAKKDALRERLTAVQKKLLRKAGLLVSFTSERQAEVLASSMKRLLEKLSDEKVGERTQILLEKKNEGLMASSNVLYDAMAGRFDISEQPYHASLAVLRIIFSYDYLWVKVRMQGGAYGCMCDIHKNGFCSFMSYRDPNLMSTYEIFRAAADYVESFDCSDRDLVKYIIGTIRGRDMPLPPPSEGEFNMACWLNGTTEEMIQKDRIEILETKQDTIRAQAPKFRAVIDTDAVCTVGSETVIKENAEMFGTVEGLFQSGKSE